MSTRRAKMVTLLGTSALVVLDAACPPYVLGGFGGTREANGKKRQGPRAAGGRRGGARPRGDPGPRFPGHPPNADSGSARRHVDRRPAGDPEADGPIRTPAGVGRVSDEYCAAASSLIRWDGTSAVVGGLSATFVGGLPIAGLRRKDGA
jgi:hypothetical protein